MAGDGARRRVRGGQRGRPPSIPREGTIVATPAPAGGGAFGVPFARLLVTAQEDDRNGATRVPESR